VGRRLADGQPDFSEGFVDPKREGHNDEEQQEERQR
jgi:hypothetical protein